MNEPWTRWWEYGEVKHWPISWIASGMRDAAGALALVPHVLEQPKMTAVSVVMALTVQTLALAWGEALRSARSRPPDFFDLLKTGGSTFTGRPWGEAATAWRAALPHWTAGDLDAALEALLAADVALKETRLSSDEQLLETLVLAMCWDTPRRSLSPNSRRTVCAS